MYMKIQNTYNSQKKKFMKKKKLDKFYFSVSELIIITVIKIVWFW